MAVDGAGNVYIADTCNNAIKERPRAFVPGGPVSEGAAAGSDQLLLPVLPTTESLTGALRPQQRPDLADDRQPLRRRDPLLLYQRTSVPSPHGEYHGARSADHGDPVSRPFLSGHHFPARRPGQRHRFRHRRLDGSWSATSNASWLHTTSSGTGQRPGHLYFDANSGATRSGTLTIAGQTLTVTQAGSSYVAANPVSHPGLLG